MSKESTNEEKGLKRRSNAQWRPMIAATYCDNENFILHYSLVYFKIILELAIHLQMKNKRQTIKPRAKCGQK